MPPKISHDEFLAKASEVHGDYYDYTAGVYRGADKKLHIICPIHDDFLQVPRKHLAGHGCIQCGYDNRKERNHTTEEFIAKSMEVHGSKYGYDKSVYVESRTPVIIRCHACKKDFEQVAYYHLADNGCPLCSNRISSES